MIQCHILGLHPSETHKFNFLKCFFKFRENRIKDDRLAAILDFGQSVSAFLANTLQSTIFVQSTSNLDMVYMTIKTQLSSNFVKIEPKTVDWRPFWTLTGSPPSGHRSLASCYDQKSINNPYVLTKTMIYRSIITKNIMFFKKMLIIAHFRSHFVFVSTK